MPVTARLSKLFYDRLGEAVTNELVDWFNQVDATYRSDLREMNEVNFARFDAKLEQRLAEFRAEIRIEFATFERKLETKIEKLDAKIDLVEARLIARMEAAMGAQTRFFFPAWAVLLASNIALWFR